VRREATTGSLMPLEKSDYLIVAKKFLKGDGAKEVTNCKELDRNN
jgi:hypothetical protein